MTFYRFITNGSQNYSATSNDKGIYALWPLPSNTTYTVSVNLQGYSFSSRVTTTVVSSYNNSGNIWGLNFSTSNPYYTLSISKAGTVYGTVTSSPDGINCGSSCSYSYNSGAVVTLTANPAATFTGWSGGGCSGKGNCNVTMDEAKNITATFTLPEGAVQLPQTGQTACYDESGNVIACAGTGQDGDKQAGAAWPSPRFTDNGDQTMTDNLTGLIWTKDANAPGPTACSSGVYKTWQGALDYVSCLNSNKYLGYNDWRLPNRKELKSLVNRQQSNPATWLNGQDFTNVQSHWYWSSNTSAGNTHYAWLVRMQDGSEGLGYKAYGSYSYVWPVRGRQSGSFGSLVISLPRTGQSTCWDDSGNVIACTGTGQDGEKQAGVAWPEPRFADNGNQTVTDILTGLVWAKDAGTQSSGACTGGAKTWQEALDHVKCLNNNNYLGYNDWRLPNIEELESLVDLQKDNPALSTGHPFNIFQFYNYWSSSTNASLADYAWIVAMSNGYMGCSPKSNSGNVWPVRGGKSGSLYASFNNYGLYKYEGNTWIPINSVNPDKMTVSGGVLYADFANYGLYKYAGGAWTEINKVHPSSMLSSDGKLYATFTGYGFYQYDGNTWLPINSVNPDKMTVSGGVLYADFASYGLYKYAGGAWSQINTVHPTNMMSSDGKLYATFASYGFYQYDGTNWGLINSVNPDKMTASGGVLYADFASYGLYKYAGGAWSQINSVRPTNMLSSGGKLYTTFTGYGFYQYDNATGWQLINSVNPESMTVSGGILYPVFQNYGFYKYDGATWTQINTVIPVKVVAGE